jgi:hypothetical protein
LTVTAENITLRGMIDDLINSNGYSDPLDEKMMLAEPRLGDPKEEKVRLPTAEEIILRLFYGWFVLRARTICDLSQYSHWSVLRVLSSLHKKGFIRKIGRATERTYTVFARVDGPTSHAIEDVDAPELEDLYVLGTTFPPERPYGFRSVLEFKPERAGIHDGSGVRTSKGIIIPAHPYYVAEVAAWIAQGLALNNFPCLATPEQVLRMEYGFCSLKKTQPKIYFRTPVPDAWLIYGPYRLRLEVQLSKTSLYKVREVVANSPLNDPVLYVVPDGEIYESLKPLLQEYPHFLLVRLWNESELSQVPVRFKRLIDQKKYSKRWWLAKYYSEPRFVHAVMNPEAAWRFECTRLEGERTYKWPKLRPLPLDANVAATHLS